MRRAVDWRYPLAIVAIAAAYVFFAEVGFSLAFATRQVTAVWPPTGIAVAALLLFGRRIWPAIWLGAFISNAISAESLVTAATIAAGNTIGPLVGVTLLRRAAFDDRFAHLRDVLSLIFIAAIGAMTITATNGALNLAFAGIISWQAFPAVWLLWWAGDAMGVLLFAPLLLTWANTRRVEPPTERTHEFAVFAVSLVAAAWLSFMTDFPLAYPVYPFLIWSALRFGQRETATAIVAICAIAIWGTTHQHGPFRAGPFDERLTLLMAFMAVLAVTGHVLAVVTAERRRARAELTAALENSRRVAGTLQSAFLPTSLPQRPNLRFDALYLPAEREALIGGDWYDAFDLPDGRVVISIGDVMGHGIGAAVTAGRIRQGIFATALSGGDPGEILANVNTMVNMQEATIATAIVAIIDRNLSAVRYASAGHPPPILASSTRAAHMLPLGNLPLGAAAQISFDTHRAALDPDSLLVFYTDGLTEVHRDVVAAEGVLLAAVGRVAVDRTIASATHALRESVMGTTPPRDDIAIIALRRLP